jgi:glycosyltransferase involved in cell wall biosynthesis
MQLYRQAGPFDVHVFNCKAHFQELSDSLLPLAPRECDAIVQPAFELSEWPFLPRPARADEDFVVGRLARPDFSKWSKRTWEIVGQVDPTRRRALLMGVDDDVRKWLGPAPDWAEVLPPGALPASQFYRRLHCLLPISHAAIESWPRIGMEAMASGVPIVAPRQGGWCDLIVHGETGYLAENAEEIVTYANLLARDEALRLRIAAQARQRLEAEFANPDHSWRGWQQVFEKLVA